MKLGTVSVFAVGYVLLAGCGQQPVKQAEQHLRPPEAQAEGAIPPPVQLAPLVPRPRATPAPKKFTVTVTGVPVDDLLFALARDAELNVDIHPDVAGVGKVTLTAIDQTLPQILDRITRQVDIRYEITPNAIIIRRDTPLLQIYRVDYPNINRRSQNEIQLSTQVLSGGAAAAGAAGAAGGANNSTSRTVTDTVNAFWARLEQSVIDILNETDKNVARLGVSTTSAATTSTDVRGQGTGAAAGTQGAAAAAGTQQVQGQSAAQAQRVTEGYEFREASRVFVNPEAGVLFVRARAKQHEIIQRYVDSVLAGAKRQVLVEATVAEVQLNNQYQRGIDWSRLRTRSPGGTGFEIRQSSASTPAGIDTNAFIIGYASERLNFVAAIKLLESFGDVRVLSSPSISVLNNQNAVLKVVDNLVYFTIDSTQSAATVSGPGLATFKTEVRSVPVGFMMSVVPQISEADSVMLNLRPTVSRKVGDVADPNPSLAQAGVSSLIPIIQTREMESLLRVQSGQIAVLGGLMQDQMTRVEDTIPGVRDVPFLGPLLSQRRDVNTKTELVIFLRATVIRDPSVDGEFSNFRNHLPSDDFFLKPNPARVAPPLGPSGEPLQ
jgi:general secretion pathway protein D